MFRSTDGGVSFGSSFPGNRVLGAGSGAQAGEAQSAIVYERGLGANVWDVDGNRYVDFMCSWGPVVLGHRHPAVEAAAVELAPTPAPAPAPRSSA